FAEIAAGHDQGLELAFTEEQMVQWRVREKNTEVAIAGRDVLCDVGLDQPGVHPSPEQRDRALNCLQGLCFGSIEVAELARGFQIGRHQRKRLPSSPLALPQ